MDNKLILTKDRAKQLKLVLDKFGETEETVKGFLKIIKEWLETQPHLPEMPSDNLIRNLLILNKFSIENAKISIDMYYTLRSLIPEVYGKCNPRLANMQRAAKTVYALPLPNWTEDGCTVTIFKLKDDNPDMFDFYDVVANWTNTLEIRFQEDIVATDISLCDLGDVKAGHIFKVTPIHFKRVVTIFEKVFRYRLKKMIMFNCPSYAVSLINTLKTFMKRKIAQRIECISGTGNLTDFVPAKMLPKEYGGTEISLEELHELWQKKLADYQDRFDALDKLRPNESLRPTPLVNDEILGFHGNFRQLSMD